MSKSKRSEFVKKDAAGSPGPGLYESPTRIGKDCHTFTIGERKPEAKPNNVPGPGEYEARDSLMRSKSPSYRIGGGEQRQEIASKNSLPGPGAYDKGDKFGKDATCYTMGEKKE